MRPSAQPDQVTIPQLDYAQTQAQRIQSALGNRAFAAGLATVATLTAPTAAILMTGVVQSKASGYFVVLASGTLQIGAVEAAGGTLSLQSNTPTVAGAAIVVAGGTANGGIQTSSATTAITLSATGGMVGAATLASEEALNGLASSALVSPYSFSGIFGVSTAEPLPRVPLGSFIAFSIAATVATTTITAVNSNFAIYELP